MLRNSKEMRGVVQIKLVGSKVRSTFSGFWTRHDTVPTDSSSSPRSHMIQPCLVRPSMISVLPSVCLIFQAADCTQPEESLKQGQEGENERKTLGWRKERKKLQRGDGMKEWKQRFMSMYLCLYVHVCGGYKSKSGDIRRILMGVGGICE